MHIVDVKLTIFIWLLHSRLCAASRRPVIVLDFLDYYAVISPWHVLQITVMVPNAIEGSDSKD